MKSKPYTLVNFCTQLLHSTPQFLLSLLQPRQTSSKTLNGYFIKKKVAIGSQWVGEGGTSHSDHRFEGLLLHLGVSDEGLLHKQWNLRSRRRSFRKKHRIFKKIWMISKKYLKKLGVVIRAKIS